MEPLDPLRRVDPSFKKKKSIFQGSSQDPNVNDEKESKNNVESKPEPQSAAEVPNQAIAAHPNPHTIMNENDHKILFSDIKSICKLNQGFLNELERIIGKKDWNQATVKLSDPFEKYSKSFKIYQKLNTTCYLLVLLCFFIFGCN